MQSREHWTAGCSGPGKNGMNASAFRLKIAARLSGLAALLVFLPGALADEAGEESAVIEKSGMYSKYIGGTTDVFDKYLGDIGVLTEEQLLPALLSALRQLSKYAVPAELPEIYRVPQERLQEMACTGKCAVLGTYRPGEGIYLDERLNPETSLFDRSVLLHELVHYVQELNGELSDMRPCDRWYHREQEAYAIQKNFLMLVGSPVRVGYSANQSTCD